MTIRIRHVFALGLSLLLGTAVLVAQSNDYIVGAQDVLGMTVWTQPGLTGKYTVGADGTFTFALMARVKVGGLTLRQIEAELRSRLADGYLKNPQVSVAIESYKSQRIFVVGEVKSPGAYPLGANMTLMEALAQAGSTTSDAGDEAVIVRSSPGRAAAGPVLSDTETNSEVVRVQLGELEAGSLSQNLRLRDADNAAPEEAHLLEHLRVLYKRRWTAVTTFVLVVLAMMLRTLNGIPVYEARVQLLIDVEAPKVLNFKDVFDQGHSPYDYEFTETQQKLLTSRSLARK